MKIPSTFFPHLLIAFEHKTSVKIPNKNWSTLILSVNDSLICWGWWSSICATFVQTSEENEQALYSGFFSDGAKLKIPSEIFPRLLIAFEFEPPVKIPNKNWSTLILSVNDSLICWGWWSSICATFVQTSEENEQALYSYFSSLSSLLYNRTARYQIRLDFQVEYQNSR